MEPFLKDGEECWISKGVTEEIYVYLLQYLFIYDEELSIEKEGLNYVI
jgi:hypothetical protein